MKYRVVKIVNSAISFSHVVDTEKLSDEQVGNVELDAESVYNKAHNYDEVRPGLINNKYAIRRYLQDVINDTRIDLDSGEHIPVANFIIINNNSRYDIEIMLQEMPYIKFNVDHVIFSAKNKSILLIENNRQAKFITLEEFKKLSLLEIK